MEISRLYLHVVKMWIFKGFVNSMKVESSYSLMVDLKLQKNSFFSDLFLYK